MKFDSLVIQMSVKVSLKVILHIENVRASPPEASKKKKQKVSKGDRDSEVLDKAMRESEQQRIELARKQEEERLKQAEVKKKAEADFKKAQSAEATRITFETLKTSFESERYAQIISRNLSLEKEVPREKHVALWKKICTHFYSSCKNHANLTVEDMGRDHEALYKEVLKKYVADDFIKHIGVLLRRKVFDKYHHVKQPICLVSIQKRIETDLFPKLAAFVPLDHLESYGLIMPDLRTFNPLSDLPQYKNLAPLCFGLFQSFYHGFNLAAAFFLDDAGSVGYRWVIFDRFQSDFEPLNVIN